jgi:uncharacterized Zn finger protein
VRENAASKAVRYLAEGRLTLHHVDDGTIRASCRGDGEIHEIAWNGGGWSCSCPARSQSCAHLTAAKLVTIRQRTA